VGHCPERNLSMSRNIGIAMSAGDCVAFIDDDAFPEAEWLRDIARGYDAPRVGGTGGRVYDHTGWRFQYGYALADRLGNAEGGLSEAADEYNFPLSNKFPYLQGTNASFRRDALLQIGGFDEEIEFYLDETDVCCRLVDAGYVLRQLPDAFVHHKFLPSHIRNAHRVTRNRFPIIKNKIYFSIVNNHGHHGVNDIIEDARRFIAQQEQDLMMHANAGRVSPEDVTQFWRDVDRAWHRGLARGLSGTRYFMHAAKTMALSAPFLEFCRPAPAGGRKVFCFLSNEYPPGRIGGIGTYTENAAREIARLGHHVHVLTQSSADNTIDFEDGVWVHRLRVKEIKPKPMIESGVPTNIWNYSGTMREEVYRLAHRRPITAIEFPIWDVEGIALVSDGSLPCIVSLHTTLGIWLDTHESNLADEVYMEEFGRPMLALERHAMLNAAGVHANSEAIVTTLRERFSVPLERTELRVIHHGIRAPGAPPKIDDADLADARVHILFVGRLERRKGIDILLTALAPLLARYETVECDVVGDDNVPWDGEATFRDAFMTWPMAQTHAGQVHFRGRVSTEDLQTYFARADILVVPSRFESFGLTVIEGFAFGKAVIAARAGGIVEIVTDGQTGILVDPEDAEALTGALDVLISDAALRERLGSAARDEFARRFSAARMGDELARFLSGFDRATVPISEIRFSGDVKYDVSLWGEETGIMLLPGSSVEFQQAASRLHLTFWRHPWSGVVRVRNGDETLADWDLYSDTPGLATFTVEDISTAGSITIAPLQQRAEASQGYEVIFYQASFPASPGAGVADGPAV
jgi:glycogen synthase